MTHEVVIRIVLETPGHATQTAAAKDTQNEAPATGRTVQNFGPSALIERVTETRTYLKGLGKVAKAVGMTRGHLSHVLNGKRYCGKELRKKLGRLCIHVKTDAAGFVCEHAGRNMHGGACEQDDGLRTSENGNN